MDLVGVDVSYLIGLATYEGTNDEATGSMGCPVCSIVFILRYNGTENYVRWGRDAQECAELY